MQEQNLSHCSDRAESHRRSSDLVWCMHVSAFRLHGVRSIRWEIRRCLEGSVHGGHVLSMTTHQTSRASGAACGTSTCSILARSGIDVRSNTSSFNAHKDFKKQQHLRV